MISPHACTAAFQGSQYILNWLTHQLESSQERFPTKPSLLLINEDVIVKHVTLATDWYNQCDTGNLPQRPCARVSFGLWFGLVWSESESCKHLVGLFAPMAVLHGCDMHMGNAPCLEHSDMEEPRLDEASTSFAGSRGDAQCMSNSLWPFLFT